MKGETQTLNFPLPEEQALAFGGLSVGMKQLAKSVGLVEGEKWLVKIRSPDGTYVAFGQ